MKNVFVVFFFLAVVFSASSQTQLEITEKAYSEYAKADDELNRMYQAIRAKYAANAKILNDLRTAQRAWLQFRDAQVKSLFPIEPGGHMEKGYGSAYPEIYARFQTYLTKERTAQLRKMYLNEDFWNYYEYETD
jgi:uncharacterized protein YecT (DUF1311 family)